MILFLNFAPLSFGGGAEKWMNDTAKKVNSYEKSSTFSVDQSIANIYGSLVLGRNFTPRIPKNQLHNHTSLELSNFIPFTSDWKKVRNSFSDSRLIYTKYELLESLIIFYFGGLSAFKKTIAGIHSPFIYSTTETFFDKLHNQIYSSDLNLKVMSYVNKIHVLNKRDESLMNNKLKLKNVVYVPNGSEEIKDKSSKSKDLNTLKVLFVGELSKRKGIEILIDLIQKSPADINYTIAGDGPYKKQIEDLAKTNKNCIYKGFISKEEVNKLYEENDVLILPSKAESMSLAILEALSHGLIILDSKDISLDLDKKIEFSADNNSQSYLKLLLDFQTQKKSEKLNRSSIKEYFKKNFSFNIVYPKLFSQLFGIKI